MAGLAAFVEAKLKTLPQREALMCPTVFVGD